MFGLQSMYCYTFIPLSCDYHMFSHVDSCCIGGFLCKIFVTSQNVKILTYIHVIIYDYWSIQKLLLCYLHVSYIQISMSIGVIFIHEINIVLFDRIIEMLSAKFKQQNYNKYSLLNLFIINICNDWKYKEH